MGRSEQNVEWRAADGTADESPGDVQCAQVSELPVLLDRAVPVGTGAEHAIRGALLARPGVDQLPGDDRRGRAVSECPEYLAELPGRSNGGSAGPEMAADRHSSGDGRSFLRDGAALRDRVG